MSIYQDEKNMSMMPEGILGAYAQGKGAKPIEEKLLALMEKSKRLGLEADKQAAMNRPMPTVADQVEHKAGLMDLQSMAKKLGMQITGIAPIGAPVQQQVAPQGVTAPTGIAAAAPTPAPMPAQAPQAPQAPMPVQHAAYGGLMHAVPHHMFNFSHGGGIMGFSGEKSSDVPMIDPKTLATDYTTVDEINPHTLAESRPHIVGKGPHKQPEGLRQETFAERDARMHNQPSLSSYSDPNSLENIGAAIQGAINKLPAESGIRKISDWMGAGAPTPAVVQNLRTAPSQSVVEYLGNLLNNSSESTKLSSNLAPAAAPTVATNNPSPTPVPVPGASANPKIVPVPNAPVSQAVGDELTREAPKVPAGLAAINKPTPVVNPNKIVQSLMANIPGAAPAAAPVAGPTEKSQAQKIAEGYMVPPDVKAEIQKEKDMAKAFGYDTPAGEDAMKRANLMEAKIADWDKSHAMDKFQALLTGIQTGGYGGGAPAAQENERGYRENVLKQMEIIHNLKSPIEQARRAEAIAKGKNVNENLAKANETASRTASSLFGEEQRAKSAKEVESMRGANAMDVQKLHSATQIKLQQMAQTAADQHRELTAQEIEAAIKNDPKYKDMSYADRLNAAYGIKTGRSDKLGVQELVALLKEKSNVYKAELANIATMPPGALEERAREIKDIEDQIKREQARLSGQPLPETTARAVAMPTTQAALKDGVIYQTANGPAKWDASKGKFVQ